MGQLLPVLHVVPAFPQRGYERIRSLLESGHTSMPMKTSTSPLATEYVVMATFYLLPPRENLERMISTVLQRLLPGLSPPAHYWDELIERISELAQWPKDVYFIPRDDLPEGNAITEALTAAFGAEADDHVVHVELDSTTLRSF